MKRLDVHLHTVLEASAEAGPFAASPASELLPYIAKRQTEAGIVMCMKEDGPDGIEQCLKIHEAYPKLYWNCNFDDRDPETVMARMARYKELGAVGVGELAINKRMDSPIIQAIFAAAEKLELPVLFHMSPEEGFNYGIVDDARLPLLEQALQQYPHLKLVGHSQPFWMEMSGDAPTDKEGRNGRGQGPVLPGGRVPELLGKYKNLYADLSAGSGLFALIRDEEYALQFLETYSDQLLFGSDILNVQSPWNSTLWQWLEEKHEAGLISTETMEKICYKNAEKLYGISPISDSLPFPAEEVVELTTPCGPIRGRKKQRTGAFADWEKTHCGMAPAALHYREFLGIRYANAERLCYPTVTTAWEGTLDAFHYGDCAMQFRAFNSEATGKDPFYYNEFRKDIRFHYSEDCQYLNIWTPDWKGNELPKKGCPVVIYIHGGAHLGGSASEWHLMEPVWTDRGVIGVTINYRLGPFGYLCTSEAYERDGHCGNYGLYDQIAAITWVKNNIAAFGGDPENITIMGQSAGAMCAQMLCTSPLTEGLFRKAILCSGAALIDDFDRQVTDADNCANGDVVMELAGVSTLAEFDKLSAWEVLQNFGAAMGKTGAGLGLSSPVLDNYGFPYPIAKAVKEGLQHHIPYLVSSTSEDLWQPQLRQGVEDWKAAEMANGNPNVQTFFFDHQLPGDDKGAFHSSDLWYWFGTIGNSWRPITEEDLQISEKMVSMLVDLAE